jgi:hypothetical protein
MDDLVIANPDHKLSTASHNCPVWKDPAAKHATSNDKSPSKSFRHPSFLQSLVIFTHPPTIPQEKWLG